MCGLNCVAKSVVTSDNAALNRPAYQSSVWSSKYPASFANDGDSKTCSASKREENPWWAVDLGRPTAVQRVDFTNSGNNLGTME